MNSLQAAAEGKGIGRMLKRGSAIGGHYGWSTRKMDRAMDRFAQILESFNCGATFPLTAITLTRNNWPLESYRSANIEFAVHGLYHVDHSRLSLQQQLDDFARARLLFEKRGIAQPGFRCPYLRWSGDTMTAVKQLGFRYDSSRSLAWPVLNGLTTDTYDRVLGFYRARSAADYPALPSYEDGIIRMPYSLPDDEALVDRLALSHETIHQPWPAILAETYRLGELFVLGLHPERIFLCESALIETLRTARSLSPGVWIARLDEIAGWWAARTTSFARCDRVGEQTIHVSVSGPKGLTVLIRGVETPAATESWDGRYRRVRAVDFEVTAKRRPFIGVTSRSSKRLASFLRQQGYIVEQAGSHQMHALILDRPEFSREDERSLLATIEDNDFPLVKLGRWPNGYRSALSITGDIDALTLWDYGLRLLGR
jgi:peptidoglycan/xylan/chitin deacetylase (PgdA/CDA1 family)